MSDKAAGHPTDVAFVDFSKYFGKVPYGCLLEKFEVLDIEVLCCAGSGISPTGRSFSVRVSVLLRHKWCSASFGA